MAATPDSSGIPSTNRMNPPGERRPITKADIYDAISRAVARESEKQLAAQIKAIATQVVGQQLGDTFDQLAKLSTAQNARLDALEERLRSGLVTPEDIDRIFQEIHAFHDYAQQLRAIVDGARREYAAIEKMLVDQKTNAKFMQRTIERVNDLASANNVLLEVLRPVHVWLGRWISQLSKSDQRRYSRVDAEPLPNGSNYGRRREDKDKTR